MGPLSPEEIDRRLGELTDREKEVLYYRCKGLDNEQLAEQLVVQLVTVFFHKRNIDEKLGIDTIPKGIRREKYLLDTFCPVHVQRTEGEREQPGDGEHPADEERPGDEKQPGERRSRLPVWIMAGVPGVVLLLAILLITVVPPLSPPQATPTVPLAVAPLAAGGVAPVLTSTPSPTLPPTAMATATPTPTATATPSPTPTPLPTATPSIQDAAELVKRYTIQVIATIPSATPVTTGGSGISLGDGYFLTATHVIQGATEVSVRRVDGTQGSARLVGFDLRRDLAILWSSDVKVIAAPIRGSEDLRAGDTLLAAGCPLPGTIGCQDITVSKGTFSSYWVDGVRYIQTDTPMNPGNSGGPLADDWGRLVGVCDFAARGPNAVGLNYAVAPGEINSFLEGPQGRSNWAISYDTSLLNVPARESRRIPFRSSEPSAVLEGYLVLFHEARDSLDIGFRIEDSSGHILTDPGRINPTLDHPYSFSVTLPRPDSYILVFENGYSIRTGKEVVVSYRTRRDR